MYASDVLDEIGHTLESFDPHVQRNVAMQWMSNRTPVDIGELIAPHIKYRLAAATLDSEVFGRL